MIIVKVPGVSNSETQGCKNSGNAVLGELKKMVFNEKGNKIDFERLRIEEIHINNSDIDEKDNLIFKNSLEMFNRNEKVIFLGGDHSITYSTGRAFLECCRKEEKEPCIIVFDAHFDALKCVGMPNNKQWLRALVETGFPAESMLIVGARQFESEEKEFILKSGIRQMLLNKLRENISEMTDTIMEFAYGKELYVSIDADVVDPAFAPAVVCGEPGGLTSRDILYILSRISLMRNLRVIDIVEIDSEKDKTGLTIKLGAKMLAEGL